MDVDPKDLTRIDLVFKSWIYSTVSDQPLLRMILKKKSTAYGVWQTLEDCFHDNKDNTAMQLKSELRNIAMGDSSVTNYNTRIKTISNMLENLGSPVFERNLLSNTLSRLSQKLLCYCHHHQIHKTYPLFYGSSIHIVS